MGFFLVLPGALGEQLLAGSTVRLINPSMRYSTWRGNDLTKLIRQVQLWVCPRFEPPTPHLCISYTGREQVYLLSFIPSSSCRSNSFTILSPSPLLGVETPPAGTGNLRQIQNIHLSLLANYLRYRMRYQIPAINFCYKN